MKIVVPTMPLLRDAGERTWLISEGFSVALTRRLSVSEASRILQRTTIPT